jgi:glycosyltransferase involved in cell wall biosynthesis
MKKVEISLVLSFYNEINNLKELINRIRDVSNRSENFKVNEIIFVNDCSNDGSEEFLTEQAKTYSDLILVNMSRKTGVSECVYAGMSVAKGDAVVYLDSDLQDPPELIQEMVDAWLSNTDCEVVYTVRKSRSGEGYFKLKFTKFGYRFLRKISKIDLPLDAGDFKLVSRKIVNILLTHQEHKPFMRGIITSLGFKQIPVYYDREPRGDGRNNTKFVLFSPRTVSGWLDSALISFSDAPLKLSLKIGLITSFLSSLYIFVVIIQKILGFYVPGWPALMAAILLLGSVQLIVLGIMGLYVNAIYTQTKNRPLYLIRNIVRNNSN